jgi:hypothetical protein
MEADTDIDRSDPTALIEALHDLLDREGQQLRRADFSHLDEQGTEKDRLIDLLDQSHVGDSAALEGLRDHARRNAALMMASLRGIRAARRRFDLLHRVQTSLNIYDNQGRRQDVTIDHASVERRA